MEKHILHPKFDKIVTKGIITNSHLLYTDFKEKIVLANNYPSSVISENTRIYSILSKGIHSLFVKEFLGILNPLLAPIEWILVDSLEKVE
jgi:hypothetical protein